MEIVTIVKNIFGAQITLFSFWGAAMILVKKLSNIERQELGKALKRAKNTKWYRRLKIIELSSKGYFVSELSQMFGLSDVTVRNYIHRYNEGGLNALRYRKSSGRPRKLDFLDDLWEIILSRSPSQFEKLKTNSRRWTLGLLVRFVECYYGENVCLQTIANALNLKCSKDKLDKEWR